MKTKAHIRNIVTDRDWRYKPKPTVTNGEIVLMIGLIALVALTLLKLI